VNVLWPKTSPTFAILRRDSTSVSFFDAELYIEVTDSPTLYDSIKSDVPVEWGPEVYTYGRREFALRDPNGYLVIFTEPTEEPPTTSEPGDESAG
jgi:hypothetical protein